LTAFIVHFVNSDCPSAKLKTEEKDTAREGVGVHEDFSQVSLREDGNEMEK